MEESRSVQDAPTLLVSEKGAGLLNASANSVISYPPVKVDSGSYNEDDYDHNEWVTLFSAPLFNPESRILCTYYIKLDLAYLNFLKHFLKGHEKQLFKIGPKLSDSTAACSLKTSGNVILAGNCAQSMNAYEKCLFPSCRQRLLM